MKRFLSFIIVFFFFSYSFASDTEENLKTIRSYFGNNWDSARLLSKELLVQAEKKDDSYGIVKANLYLGFILSEQKDYAKSVLYCLEGIRQAEERDYEGIHKDKLWLRKNIAITFRKFEANSLATKYNLEAIEIAISNDITKQIISLKLNQALVYQSNDQYAEAIQFLTDILPLIEEDNFFRRSEIVNQIGLIYLESKDFDKAEEYFEKVLKIPSENPLYKAKSLHNLGEIHYELGDVEKSIDYLRQAITLMSSESQVNNYGIFLSYRNIGRYLSEVGQEDEALEFLKKAEEIASYAEHDPSSFKIYRTFSNIYYSKGLNELGEKYINTYVSKTEDFLETQEEIQRKDKEYNFDLITKRYFDEVAKQEKIASILFYSKTISGSLLFLLLLTVGYNRYQKVQLRKHIVRELVELKMID